MSTIERHVQPEASNACTSGSTPTEPIDLKTSCIGGYFFGKPTILNINKVFLLVAGILLATFLIPWVLVLVDIALQVLDMGWAIMKIWVNDYCLCRYHNYCYICMLISFNNQIDTFYSLSKQCWKTDLDVIILKLGTIIIIFVTTLCNI